MAIKKTEYLKFGENLYEIIPPLPSGTDRGGIIASPKESTDTVEVKLGGDGKLYVPTYPPSSSADVSGVQAQIDEHKSNTDVHITSEERNKLSGIETTVDNKISLHNTSDAAHSDIRLLISDLTTEVNNFLDVDDTTRDQLSEVLALIDSNKGTLESLTISKINVSDIVDNLTTASATKVLSAKQGVAIKALIDALQSAVATKADSTHNHNDLYYKKEEVDNAVAEKTQVQMVTLNETDSITEKLSTLKIHKLTREQYEEKLANGTIDETALYLTPDEEIDLTPYATIEQLNEKSDIGHTHVISDVTDLQAKLDSNLATSKSYTDTKVSGLASTAKSYSDANLEIAKEYTDSKAVVIQMITWEAND